jgi:hypothetical protein
MEPITARSPSRLTAALAGLLAGGLALGVAELIAGLLPGAPSPVLAIGSLLIALQPKDAKQLVVDLFGTNDKLVLNLVVLAGALALAAGLGLLGLGPHRLPSAGWAGPVCRTP